MPVQPQLPVWFTCIHEDSFARAGEAGVGVLGYLMNQTVEELAAKIVRYRESLQQAGHDPSKGHVTILLHTFVGEDYATVREQARGPLKEYLRSYLDNSQKKIESQNGALDVAQEDLEYLLEKSYNDYVGGKTLIGTPETCAAVTDRLREIGVDEVGCLVDFGVDPDRVLEGLRSLNKLREHYAVPGVEAAPQERIFRSPNRRPACGCSGRRTGMRCGRTTNPPRWTCAGRWMSSGCAGLWVRRRIATKRCARRSYRTAKRNASN